jgi:hypothetical protein
VKPGKKSAVSENACDYSYKSRTDPQIQGTHDQILHHDIKALSASVWTVRPYSRRASLTSSGRQHPAPQLVPLDRLEQRPEVALAKPIVTLALDELEEHSFAAFLAQPTQFPDHQAQEHCGYANYQPPLQRYEPTPQRPRELLQVLSAQLAAP